MSRLGIIGDLHAPFTHPMYRNFIQDTFQQWGVNKVHFIGDIVDNHATSFHEHDPDGRSAGDEGELAQLEVAKWYKTFPKATVSIGNHDELQFRKARFFGVSNRFLKDYKTAWGTPGWDWQFEHIVDNTLLEHGTGNSGKDAAINLAIQKRMNVAIGHIHSWGGVKYHTNPTSRIFGINVGCGMDNQAYAFAYGRTFAVRPTLGCAIVLDGVHAYFEPMLCSKGETYHRRRA